MIIHVDRTGTLEGFHHAVHEVAADERTRGVMVLACEQNNFQPHEINPLLRAVEKPLFGGLFPEVMNAGERLQYGSVVLGLPLPSTVRVIGHLSGPPFELREAVKRTKWHGRRRGTLFVFVDGFATQVSSLIRVLFDRFGLEINYLGGGAGSLESPHSPCIISNSGLLQDAAVMAFSEVHSAIGVAHGWTTLSEPVKVTRSEGNVVRELDYRNAYDVYSELVSQHIDVALNRENFFEVAKGFPFGMHRMQSEVVVRDPITLGEGGSLVCVGEVPQGSLLHLLKGDNGTLIEAAEVAAKRARSTVPHGAAIDLRLFFDCISRALFLEDEFEKELAVVRNGEPLYGALTLGEIANNGIDFLEFYNKTSVVALLSEPDETPEPEEPDSDADGASLDGWRQPSLIPLPRPVPPVAAHGLTPKAVETEILLELTLSIDGSNELKAMLDAVLQNMLRLLNASAALVLQHDAASGDDGSPLEPVSALPRNSAENPIYREFLSRYPLDDLYRSLRDSEDQIPLVVSIEGAGVHAFELPGFGVLIIVRNAGQLSPSFTRGFAPLAQKLAHSALACLADEDVRLSSRVFELAQEGIMITDAKNRILKVNRAFSEITGYTEAEVVGRDPKLLASGSHDPSFYARMWQSLRETGAWRGELTNLRKNGDLYPQMTSITRSLAPSGALTHYVAVLSDITVLKRHERELERLAHYDKLTDLPNRRLLEDRIQQSIAQTRRSGRMMAVALLDLDRFKPVNDTWGHAAGDEVLKTIAARLQSHLRGGDTAARLGGDEFALVLLGINSVAECSRSVERLVATISEPMELSFGRVSVSASVGVTLFPQDESDCESLLRHADQAMYVAKQSGENRYHLYQLNGEA